MEDVLRVRIKELFSKVEQSPVDLSLVLRFET